MDFTFLEAYPRVLFDAALLTIALSVAALVGGGLIGLLVAVARTLGGVLVDVPLGVVVDLVRGTPLLVQLLIWYLGSSVAGLELSPFGAAAIGLSVNAGAFISEIVRGVLRALPKGQREAALAIGLSRTYSLRAIELPQAMPMMLPALVSYYIGLIKDTSIAYIVGLHELLRSAQFIADYERRPLEIYLVIALVYFSICFPLSRLAAVLEGRLRRSGISQSRLDV
jgi:polar amino acid transport system permease protein